MSRVVVADAGPLVALARIARLQLLHHLSGPVVVPTAVSDGLRLDLARPGAQLY